MAGTVGRIILVLNLGRKNIRIPFIYLPVASDRRGNPDIIHAAVAGLHLDACGGAAACIRQPYAV